MRARALARRFYNLVLYPRIRQDFEETKKLNYHLYMALKKSLYKPAAFFKGILLPLCEVRGVPASHASARLRPLTSARARNARREPLPPP